MKDAKELKLMTLEDVLSQIENGMTIGIGTGSTIELLIPQIAELIQQKRIIQLPASVLLIKQHF